MKERCNKENMKYNIECRKKSRTKDLYHGDTSYCAYTRGKENLETYNNSDTTSALHNHYMNEQQGNRVEPCMNITGTFHREPTLRHK